MLLVDNRIGSKDLLVPLQEAGVPCELQHLDFADFAFIGKGLNGIDAFVGVELKRYGTDEGRSDLLRSMMSKRFAGHQLIGLRQTYGDDAWLLTEGIHRKGHEGNLEILCGREWKPATIGRRYIMSSTVDSWILSQMIRGGVSHWHAPTRHDTIHFLSVLYRWWTDKELQEHRSHQAVYLPRPDRAMLIEPSHFLKSLVGLIDGLGWSKALAIEELCGGSLRVLSGMTVQDLQTIPGVGKVLASRILAALA